ncbi:MAG: hypothetical protein IPF55_16570 [Rhodoferax sp.]|nr:hypothetical protein [Rhodoferax sp.]
MFSRALCWLIGLSFAAMCYAEAPIALATVVEGDATLLRQTTRLAVKPGMRLLALDMLETGPKTNIVRIEFTGGAIADLGPQTQVMLAPKLASGAKHRRAPLYALSGWVKLSGTPSKDPAASPLLSESLDLSGLNGNAVVSIQAKASHVFAESGTVTVTERRQGQAVPPTVLKSGTLYSRTGNEKASVSAHPASAFMQSVPKPFLDPIPARTDTFKGRAEPPAKVLGDLTYADATPWLGAELPVRTLLVTHWKAQLNPDLRAGLTSHIRSHPEWDRVLFPEKYLPVNAASAASAPATRP